MDSVNGSNVPHSAHSLERASGGVSSYHWPETGDSVMQGQNTLGSISIASFNLFSSEMSR